MRDSVSCLLTELLLVKKRLQRPFHEGTLEHRRERAYLKSPPVPVTHANGNKGQGINLWPPSLCWPHKVAASSPQAPCFWAPELLLSRMTARYNSVPPTHSLPMQINGIIYRARKPRGQRGSHITSEHCCMPEIDSNNRNQRNKVLMALKYISEEFL